MGYPPLFETPALWGAEQPALVMVKVGSGDEGTGARHPQSCRVPDNAMIRSNHERATHIDL